MRNLGYLRFVNENQNARRVVCMAMALPLLPAQNMKEGLQAIREEAARHNLQMDTFFSYIQRY